MTVGKTYDQLDERLRGWIDDQHIFFVATAPSGPGGHVNLSPKGHADTFTILDGRTVAYLDLTGSGAETAAHLRDNGRITLMFCAFSGPPRILRLYGRGRLAVPGGDRWEELAARFPTRRGARAVVVVALERIADSCGYAVPCYRYVGQRDLLEQWVQRRDDAAIAAYRTRRNRTSIDNLPALPMVPGHRQAVRVWDWMAGGGREPTEQPMHEGRKPI
jgi:Pyridoxamine 5'-phosphate oxidase